MELSELLAVVSLGLESAKEKKNAELRYGKKNEKKWKRKTNQHSNTIILHLLI